MLIQKIDQIGREKHRDVLWVAFHDLKTYPLSGPNPANSQRRKDFVRFLDEHRVPWYPCYPLLSANWLAFPYYGSIYLDIPYDTADPLYQTVADYLETPDGAPKIRDVHFLVLDLETAVRMDRLESDLEG